MKRTCRTCDTHRNCAAETARKEKKVKLINLECWCPKEEPMIQSMTEILGPAIDKTWLERKYITEQYSTRDIGEMCHRHKDTICYWIRKFGIPLRGKESNFTPRTREKRRQRQLGKKQTPEQIEKRTSKLRLENHPRWKGGKHINKDGYVFMRSPGHPMADKRGYVAEHRLVAEMVLGRYLKKTELIHHVNKNPNDNRNKNLVICENDLYHKLIHKRMNQLMEK